MDNSKNRHNENLLGVNKMGKNIRKSPIHQPNYGNNSTDGSRQQQQPQPQVYNISKNDFRDIVQQLTGSPSPSLNPPSKPSPHHNNSPKPQSMRLQKIRPPPLPHVRSPLPVPMPLRPVQFRQPSPTNPLSQSDITCGNNNNNIINYNNVAVSPISAYMRYLEHSIIDPGSRGNQFQPQPQQVNGPVPVMLPSPRLNGPLPSPQANGPPPIFPSPTSQFLLPSPNGYMNFLSPRSPYPLLMSPGIHFPSPFTPNFPFSPFGQSGLQQPPLSPGLFPLSPSGFFPITSPRW